MTLDITEYINNFSYAGIFLWFAILEQLTPIPEEVSLMSVGYFCVYQSLNPFLCGIVSLLGLLSTDMFLFFVSMKGSKMTERLMKKINASVVVRIQTSLRTNAAKAIFVMALVPKLRFVSPIVSGLSGISWKTFLVVNGLATLLYVTVYLCIGIFFHQQLHRVFQKVQYMQHGLFIAVMAALVLFIIYKIRKHMLNTHTQA